MKKKEISFLAQELAHFRLPFHNRVREILEAEGIEYRLIFGDPPASNGQGEYSRLMSWAEKVRSREFSILGHHFYWQPALSLVKSSDLTVIGQENKLLINIPLQIKHILGRKKVAFFGHGVNFQSKAPQGLRARITKFRATKVDWWFAYNDLTARIIEGYGFSPDRITSVQNAIDTDAIRRDIDDISTNELLNLKKSLRIDSEQIGVYIGRMYNRKRLPFLIEAAKIIRQRVPNFHLILIGSGSASSVAKEASRALDYVHYLGALYGREKSSFAKLSKVFLMPGLVGLAVLDSFAYGIPMVTTAVPYHSPEIDYLRSGENGIIVDDPDDPSKYADAVVKLLKDDNFRNKLVTQALKASRRYTIENMARNFSAGAVKALTYTQDRV